MISVIVPAYNAADTIGECLDALLNQTVPRSEYEVIVVDDGSTDETRDIAHLRGVKVICQSNQGPASARNLGVCHARGELILFTDADCVPARDWIERMSAPLLDPNIDGAKGVYRTRQRNLVARFVQLEYEDKYDRVAQERFIDFVDTYAAAYRKPVFSGNGGFDPAFPRASGEDIDFSWRLARKGHKLVFAPDAVVYHRHVSSLASYFRRKYSVGYWRALMYRRHPNKVVSDSHTPQSLKIQVGLAGLLSASLIGQAVGRISAWWPASIAFVFLLTGAPFLCKALRRDRSVAIVAPPLLLVRAFALGTGLFAGLIYQGVEGVRRNVP